MNDSDTGLSTELDDEQLAELDRLRTASLLSAGLAHEVANPLLGVLANLAEIERIYPRLRASMSAEHAERWEALADCLDQAHRSADAIADVIRDFQVFLRPASNRVERLVEPAPLVERAVRMASPRLRITAEVHSAISKAPLVKAPPSFITQIALNLLTNAAEALATSGQEHRAHRGASHPRRRERRARSRGQRSRPFRSQPWRPSSNLTSPRRRPARRSARPFDLPSARAQARRYDFDRIRSERAHVLPRHAARRRAGALSAAAFRAGTA